MHSRGERRPSDAIPRGDARCRYSACGVELAPYDQAVVVHRKCEGTVIPWSVASQSAPQGLPIGTVPTREMRRRADIRRTECGTHDQISPVHRKCDRTDERGAYWSPAVAIPPDDAAENDILL